jgi:hypothetical protein
MKFIYLVFLSLWSAILIALEVAQVIKLCKDNETKAIVFDSFLVVFFLGLLAQFIASGVQLI